MFLSYTDELLIICGNATKENPLKMLRNMTNEIINGEFQKKRI